MALHESAQSDYSKRVYTEQIRQVYALLPVGLLATAVNSTVVAILLWGLVPHAILLAWAGGLILLAAARMSIYFIRFRKMTRPGNIERLGRIFLVSMSCSGFLWGLAAFFGFFHEALPHEVMVSFVLGGMSAGVAATFSALRAAYYSFAIPALLPQAVLFLMVGDPIHVAMGGMIILFGILIGVPAEANARISRSNLWLQFEREDLVQSLSREIDDREQAQGALREAHGELEKKVAERTAELAQANADLRRSEGLYRSIFETVQEGIWIIGSDMRIRHANARMANLLGYGPDELPGHQLREFLMDRDLDFYSSGKMRDFRELEIRTLGGKKIWVLEAASRLDLSILRQEVILCIVTDITGIKEREATILDLNHKLKEANRELSDFTHSVSHDLRSPILSIEGFTQAVEEDFGQELPAPARNYLARIRAAARRMKELIEDLLTLSRISRTELHFEEVNLSKLAQEVIDALQAIQPNRDILKIIESGIFARCDPKLIRIVFENLLGNAWKFTGRQERPEIEFGVRFDSGRAIYFVRDNGVGFDMNYASRLFTPFQRLHTDTDFPGTGVGLATVQRIIRRHDGTIWADSAPGQGAIFYFTLLKGQSLPGVLHSQNARNPHEH